MLNCQWQVMTDSLAKESLVNADHSLTKPLPLFEAPIKVKVPEVSTFWNSSLTLC